MVRINSLAHVEKSGGAWHGAAKNIIRLSVKINNHLCNPCQHVCFLLHSGLLLSQRTKVKTL